MKRLIVLTFILLTAASSDDKAYKKSIALLECSDKCSSLKGKVLSTCLAQIDNDIETGKCLYNNWQVVENPEEHSTSTMLMNTGNFPQGSNKNISTEAAIVIQCKKNIQTPSVYFHWQFEIGNTSSLSYKFDDEEEHNLYWKTSDDQKASIFPSNSKVGATYEFIEDLRAYDNLFVTLTTSDNKEYKYNFPLYGLDERFEKLNNKKLCAY